MAEIAASSAAIDMNAKKNAYRRNGLQEYIVWQVFENKLDWFRLHEGEYVLLKSDAAGIIKSEVFPGLWLAVSAWLQGDMQSCVGSVAGRVKFTSTYGVCPPVVRTVVGEVKRGIAQF